ncbi:MAG: cold shock domain-containing protein [Desulfobacteraceae bacterium]|nr:cold shock domain-containing protein [Desulfobacteraceae bacterium]
MAVGFVLSFNDNDGYGFIETDEGEQFFVHHSAIEMQGFRTLAEGDQVMFDVATTKRGKEAVHVRKLS